MQCVSCEKDNPEGAAICSQCGLPLTTQRTDAPHDKTLCPSCQSLNVTGSFFCYSCGNYFGTGGEEPSGNGAKPDGAEVIAPPAIKGRIIIPCRPDIILNGNPVFVERSSFDPTLPHDVLMSISRQHILVTYDSGIYYVQDHGRDGTGSTNHTRLNGTDIYRKGRQPLKDGDRLELSKQSELTLTFKTE